MNTKPIKGFSFQKFIIAIRGKKKCPACESETLPMIYADGNEKDSYIFRVNSMNVEGAYSASYLAVCPICGYLWHFDKSTVDEWVANNTDKSDL